MITYRTPVGSSPLCSPVAKARRFLSQPCLRLRCNKHLLRTPTSHPLGSPAERLNLILNKLVAVREWQFHQNTTLDPRASSRSPANRHFASFPAMNQKIFSRKMRSFCLCESPFNAPPHPYIILLKFSSPSLHNALFLSLVGCAVGCLVAVHVVNVFRYKEANAQDH